jgi:hypothetical protein
LKIRYLDSSWATKLGWTVGPEAPGDQNLAVDVTRGLSVRHPSCCSLVREFPLKQAIWVPEKVGGGVRSFYLGVLPC